MSLIAHYPLLFIAAAWLVFVPLADLFCTRNGMEETQ